ncbi:enoyl-CoA hydratase [Stakelama tenebrarum]|uniref:Enoyl-CoA hydratase n=1 Tax=Stakelama tenebrarum TaxID=2711215 RepID=A0A6G6Y682_9SPHN|nr:enoyl-CoA hydratase [Sphingosinithalassobacter tenebrarum]QIG80442.1 enoyl-CoA hydratase [Sphingosinithalassobacter tenebrarum]
MTDHIEAKVTDSVLTLVLNRPDKKNALTDAMYGTLANELFAAQEDADIRVIVIRGEGDMFCSGNDIADFVAAGGGDIGERGVGRFLHALADNMKPLIAAVHGKAVGVGLTMLLHCDQVVLSEDAELVAPFVNLALVPEAGSSLLLPERIGHARAYRVFALGEPIGAADALAWGLANEIVARDRLTDAANALAQRLAKQPLGALIATKRLMRDPDAIRQRVDIESRVFGERLKTPEAQEAFAAFSQRRAPDFTSFG